MRGCSRWVFRSGIQNACSLIRVGVSMSSSVGTSCIMCESVCFVFGDPGIILITNEWTSSPWPWRSQRQSVARACFALMASIVRRVLRSPMPPPHITFVVVETNPRINHKLDKALATKRGCAGCSKPYCWELYFRVNAKVFCAYFLDGFNLIGCSA